MASHTSYIYHWCNVCLEVVLKNQANHTEIKAPIINYAKNNCTYYENYNQFHCIQTVKINVFESNFDRIRYL